MPDLVIYTVADLRHWVLHNQATKGLSMEVISPVRAWAIIHNPYVQNDDSVVAAIFVDGVVAACVSAFPEVIKGQRFWWFSALWCTSVFRGQGYGIIVIGSLAEIYGYEYCLDRWGADEAIQIFSYLGHNTVYTPRFIMGKRKNRSSAKGKFIFLVRAFQMRIFRLLKNHTEKEVSELRYLPYIDNETYAFIQRQQKDDLFLHSQEMLNWELRYPFTISAPVMKGRVSPSPFFSTDLRITQVYAVQVRDNGRIAGFYMMKQNNDSLHLLYLYYTEEARHRVFASISNHIITMRVAQFDTDEEELASYLRQQGVFPSTRIVNISFSFPSSFSSPNDRIMQYGDGDNFAVVS